MGTLPLPGSISVKTLTKVACGDKYECAKWAELHIKSFVDTDSDLQVSQKEAYAYVQKTEYGHSESFFARHPISNFVLGAIRHQFFSDSPFDGKHSAIKTLVIPAEAISFSDGDTFASATSGMGFTITLKVGEETKRLRFRFAGSDTPESIIGINKKGQFKPNPKLDIFRDAIWLYFFRKHKLNPKGEWITKRMIRNRIIYTGRLAGAVSKGLKKWALEKKIPFNVGPSFDRTKTTPHQCNTIVLSDVYGRIIGVPGLGKPGSDKNYLAFFIKDELHKIMAADGMDLYNYYRHGQQPHGKTWTTKVGALDPNGKKLLAYWRDQKTGGKPVWDALAPETLPNPSLIYSEENCKELAEEWKTFTDENPKYRNDIQAMMIFVGLAWAYPKYTTQHTKMYAAIERFAMGPNHPKPVKKISVGLWGDKIFGFMQPNPKISPVFDEFEYELSRDKNMLPPDCCDVLESQGKDIFDHCP